MRKVYLLLIATIALFSTFGYVRAQKLTTTQPTVICDPSTLTNCAPVSATNGQSVTVAAITAAATGTQTAANSDSIACSTDLGCRPGAAISVTTTMQNGATANGNGTVLAVDGQATAVVTAICSVSCSGGTQLIFEAQNDGSNFVAVKATQSGTDTIATTFTLSGTSAVAFKVEVGGYKQLRSRILNYSAGTITVVGTTVAVDNAARTVNSNLMISGTTVDGNSGNKSAQTLRVVLATDQPALSNKLLVTPDSVALPANQSVNVNQLAGTTTDTNSGTKSAGTLRTVLATDQPTLTNSLLPVFASNGAAAGTDRYNINPGIAQTSYQNGTAATQGRNMALNVGTDGLLWVASLPSIRPASYTASSNFAASSTTDNSCLPGNASNTVLLTEVQLSGTQTTAGIVNAKLIKRSTAGSGGTSANMTVVPDDSNYAAGVSVPVSYTGTGPTVGTAVGDIVNAYTGFLAAATASPDDVLIANFRQKPIVLRGTGEKVCVNLGGALSGGNMSVTYKWIETATITP